MKYEPLIRRTFRVHSTSGDEFRCWCPFHDDTGHPNLYANGVKGFYFCHSCGARGHVQPRNSDQRCLVLTDTQYLRARIEHMKSAPPSPLQPRSDGWLRQFTMHDYWTDERGFSERIVKMFDLGYDPMAGMLTIPIRTSRGKVLGVIYRRLDGQKPKYLHPKGFKKGQDLFASWLVRKSGHQRVAVVEGPLDAVACWDAHIPAVAMHGARLSPDQAHIIRSLGVTSVVVMTDNDPAGDEAAHSVKEALRGVQVLVGQYRTTWDVKDVAELSTSQRRRMWLSARPYHRVWA